MTRRQWREPHASVERWYGLGTMSGSLGPWDWFGHTGGFPGTLTRTACVPAHDLAVSLLTNAADGPAQGWMDGALRITAASFDVRAGLRLQAMPHCLCPGYGLGIALRALTLPPPLTRTAIDLGSERVANMVALGALAALTGLCERAALERTVRAETPRSHVDLNLDALAAGWRLAEALALDRAQATC